MRDTLILILVTALFAGCGYKGPLYLPKSKPEAQKPAVKPAPPREETKLEGS